MTLVIGVKCSNGIVIGSDRKVMRGPEPSFDNKIFEHANVIFGFSGVTGIFDDFLDLLSSEMERARGFGSLYEVKLVAEDVVADLYKRYRERIGEESEISLLMGGRRNLTSGETRLYHILGKGYGEATAFTMIGSGYPPAASITKFLVRRDLTMEENARRIAFVIGWIREAVDTNVGGTPHIAMVKDGEGKVEYLPEAEAEELAKQGEQARENLAKLVGIEE